MDQRNTLDGGEAILEAFRALGADYIMSSPGSEWGAVWEALARQKVSNRPGPIYINCAHETLAVDLAIGYTAYTRKMQVVMLHTGVGLLQGAMGIDAAFRQEIPMLIVSGESMTYGDKPGFNPGPQWQAMLSVVGNPHRLVEPFVKWANQLSSVHTAYDQLIRAGEMAQRSPKGPTYMSVPIETTLEQWTPPDIARDVPAPSKTRAAAEDVEAVAKLLVAAKAPAILTDSAGEQEEGYNALVELAEELTIPVADSAWPFYANFPRDHALYQGHGQPDYLQESDLIVLVKCRSPWYPPSNRPHKAKIVAIDDAPLKPHMVHQSLQAESYLEGDTPETLKALTEAVRDLKGNSGWDEEKRDRLQKDHDAMVATNKSVVDNHLKETTLHPIAAISLICEMMPDDTVYVDETITARPHMVKYLDNKGPRSYFRVHGGLGQAIGTAMGVKLAAKDRPVVSIMGDGTFMYNPIVQALAFGKDFDAPVMVVVLNNGEYAAMRKEHHAYYRDGVAAEHSVFPGSEITGLDYSKLAKPFDAKGYRAESPDELRKALEKGRKKLEKGRSVLINVVVSE